MSKYQYRGLDVPQCVSLAGAVTLLPRKPCPVLGAPLGIVAPSTPGKQANTARARLPHPCPATSER